MSEQPEAPVTPATAGRGRGRGSVGDMVRSMLLVLVFVGVLVAFNAVGQPDPVLRRLDYPAAIDSAQARADYPLAGPRPLPAGWTVTSARLGSATGALTWHLGMVTSAGSYAAVEQSDGTRAELVAVTAEGGRRAGTARVGGRTWQRLEGGDPHPRALLREDGGVVTVLAGDASWRDLRVLAASVR